MRPKKAIFAVFIILLLLLTGCRRFGRTDSSRPTGIVMAPETQQTQTDDSISTPASSRRSGVSAASTTPQNETDTTSSAAVSQTVTSPQTQSVDPKEVNETLDEILSELTGLDSLYTQMDGVSESDFNN